MAGRRSLVDDASVAIVVCSERGRWEVDVDGDVDAKAVSGRDEGRRPPGLPFNGTGKWGLGPAWLGSKLSSSGICICISAWPSPSIWAWPEARAGCIVWLTRWFREWGLGSREQGEWGTEAFIVIEKAGNNNHRHLADRGKVEDVQLLSRCAARSLFFPDLI